MMFFCVWVFFFNTHIYVYFMDCGTILTFVFSFNIFFLSPFGTTCYRCGHAVEICWQGNCTFCLRFVVFLAQWLSSIFWLKTYRRHPFRDRISRKFFNKCQSTWSSQNWQSTSVLPSIRWYCHRMQWLWQWQCRVVFASCTSAFPKLQQAIGSSAEPGMKLRMLLFSAVPVVVVSKKVLLRSSYCYLIASLWIWTVWDI